MIFRRLPSLKPVPLDSAEPPVLREEAVRAAARGDHDRAVQLHRRAIAEDLDVDRAYLEYARYLVQRSNSAAAEEVLAAALMTNGANDDALELYLEVARKRELSSAHTTWAFEGLQEALPDHLDRHRGALDYVIPYRLERGTEVLTGSPDPVCRAAVALNSAHIEDRVDDSVVAQIAAETGLPPHEVDRARLIVLLGRGKMAPAVSLAQSMPASSIPINSLRRAIRRAVAKDKIKQAYGFLEMYSTVRPEDGWAKSMVRSLDGAQYSNSELTVKGFPFPAQETEPAYTPVQDRTFYLLHNSLPHHSAGYATRTHGLLTELNRSGWDVDGVTRLGYPYDMPGKADIPDVPMHDKVDGVDYFRLLTGREIEKKSPVYFYTQRYSSALQKLALQRRPGVIHAASNHWNGLTAVSVARGLGIPSIYEVRGLWEVTRGSRNPEWAQGNMFKFMARMEADAAAGATKVFAITEALREEMINRGVDGEKITVLPNGVDTQRFTPVPRDVELARTLGIADKTVIGYVGSILNYEGLELLIEVAERWVRERTDFHMLFVGDGAELETFQDLTVERGLEDVITFTGRVPFEDVERYYSLIDIAPFPRMPLPVCEMVSPLKPFEAMAMGKAVLASDVAALAEIVTPGVNGFRHTKGDAESLRRELERYLDDPELMRRMGHQAREWVVQNRDWRQIAPIVADTYAELTKDLPL